MASLEEIKKGLIEIKNESEDLLKIFKTELYVNNKNRYKLEKIKELITNLSKEMENASANIKNLLYELENIENLFSNQFRLENQAKDGTIIELLKKIITQTDLLLETKLEEPVNPSKQSPVKKWNFFAFIKNIFISIIYLFFTINIIMYTFTIKELISTNKEHYQNLKTRVQNLEKDCNENKDNDCNKNCPDLKPKDLNLTYGTIKNILFEFSLENITLIKELNINLPELKQEIKNTYNIYFNLNESNLTPSGEEKLREIKSDYSDEDIKQIIVSPSTDTTGKTSWNEELENKRAASIKLGLINKGFSGKKIKIIPLKEKPIKTNDCTKEPLNRSAKIEIICKDKINMN